MFKRTNTCNKATISSVPHSKSKVSTDSRVKLPVCNRACQNQAAGKKRRSGWGQGTLELSLGMVLVSVASTAGVNALGYAVASADTKYLSDYAGRTCASFVDPASSTFTQSGASAAASKVFNEFPSSSTITVLTGACYVQFGSTGFGNGDQIVTSTATITYTPPLAIPGFGPTTIQAVSTFPILSAPTTQSLTATETASYPNNDPPVPGSLPSSPTLN
jgi:hypothetical protein